MYQQEVISIGTAFLGSGLLFVGLLYYRAENHFIFFPNRVPTLSPLNTPKVSLLSKVQARDLVFISDFFIVLLVLLGVFILNKRRKVNSEMVKVLADYQSVLSTLRPTLDQVEKDIAAQKSYIQKLKESGEQLKDENNELLQKRSDLQDKCRNSQPGLQKEIAYCKTENANLTTSLKRLETLKDQLETEQLQKEQALEAAKAQQVNLAEETIVTAEKTQQLEEIDPEQKSLKNRQRTIFDVNWNCSLPISILFFYKL